MKKKLCVVNCNWHAHKCRGQCQHCYSPVTDPTLRYLQLILYEGSYTSTFTISRTNIRLILYFYFFNMNTCIFLFWVTSVWLICMNKHLFSNSSYLDCLSTNTESISHCLNSNFPAFSTKELIESKDEAKQMFQFGYDNYMEHAYPHDELDPIHCAGRGHDYTNE